MKKKISAWLKSGEYKTDLATLCTDIVRESSVAETESQVASAFENNIYYIIRNKTGLKVDYRKEQPVEQINHVFSSTASKKSTHGRLDAIINQFVIEYKHPSKLSSNAQFDKAVEQVTEYLDALYAAESSNYMAVLTDGTKVAYFTRNETGVEHSSLKAIDSHDVDLIIRAILQNHTKRFESSNILKDFAINAPSVSVSKSIALELYSLLSDSPTDKTKMLFAEWQNLMHLSVEDNAGKSNDIEKRRKDLSLIFNDAINNSEVEYKALYALQTTYAIIVKLIACKIIDKIEYNSASNEYYDLSKVVDSQLQDFLAKMEDGYSYRSNNISNFLEGDFFSWYSDKNQWSAELGRQIKSCIEAIEQYSAFSFNIKYHPIDIFKDLYMSMIPKSLRHSMGEYFTPSWLSDRVVSESIKLINNSEWKAVDPCCGSGIFILTLIKHIVGDTNIIELSDSQRRDFQKDIVTRVYGIDINPLSVLSARVGYYLALQPFGDVSDIDIPVYLGDSAIIPTKVDIDGFPCYKYSVTNDKLPFDVVLPESFVKNPDFSSIMSELQSLVKADNPDILSTSIISNFTEEEKASNELTDCIKELSQKLITLHKNAWDGIWIRISSNFMLIARMEEMDMIVGNPPWVKWEHLPAAYANKIKNLCDIRHIFCNDGGQYGGTQLNICALIANVTAANWLTKNGVLAFLMPDSIMSQNSYEEFRNFYLDYAQNERLYLQKLDKWAAPLRPFHYEDTAVTQDFNTYYYARKVVDYTKGVPVDVISKPKNSRVKINSFESFEDAKPHLTFGTTTASQYSSGSTAFSFASSKYDFSKIIGATAYDYRTGVEFTPQELFMLVGAGDSKKGSGFYRFNNKQFMLSKYKITDTPKGGWELPTKYIYPIVTSPAVSKFKKKPQNDYCIIPYDESNLKKPVSPETLLKSQKKLYMYLLGHNDIIDKQSEKSKMMHRGDEFYALSKIGPYTFAPFIVAARDNTSFCATVVERKETPWGETKQSICVKHTIIVSQRKGTKAFITKDEAYFICGIFNCDIVSAYMKASFKTNGISLNKSHLYLPLYDKSNAKHKKIASLAKKASSNPTEAVISKSCTEISKLYLELCDNK